MTDKASPGRPNRREQSPRLPMALCAAVSEILSGSHSVLEDMFYRAGAVGEPPDLPHHAKWKTWLFELGKNPAIDRLSLIGQLMEEFMDLPPIPAAPSGLAEILGPLPDPIEKYRAHRDRLERVLEEHGLRYYRGGRVLPLAEAEQLASSDAESQSARAQVVREPKSVEELLRQIIKGLPRAIYPLANRRRDAVCLSFTTEYDIQDLLHSQLRPWIADIRPEEHTPSYAGKSTRMDFLLAEYHLVLEVKRVRSREHARAIGDELIIDIAHYQSHQHCHRLWCVIYDPDHLIQNPAGLVKDLQGKHGGAGGNSVLVEIYIFGPAS